MRHYKSKIYFINFLENKEIDYNSANKELMDDNIYFSEQKEIFIIM